MKSTQPFPATLKKILEIEGISERQLTERARRKGYDRHHSTLHRIYAGDGPVQPEHMEGVARALNIAPETFAEYRLWKARTDYDPGVIGWKRAIRNLQRLEGDEAPEVEEPLSASEIDRRLSRADEPGDQAESS